MRWLLETNRKVKKLVLVAPAKIPATGDEDRMKLYDFELPSTPVSVADEVVIFVSNDQPRMLQSFELYKQALNPKIIELKDKGHFTIFTMKTSEFPELLTEILNN